MVPQLRTRRSARARTGGTPATDVLDRAGTDFSLHPYDHDPAASSYGLEAAEQLGLDPAAVFKTLLAQVDGDFVVALVPVSAQLDLKKLAVAIGGKRAALADPAVAERVTGYVVGGISPIGQRRRLTTVIDESARGRRTVYVSAGRRGLDLGLAPDHLVELLGARVAPIGRPRRTDPGQPRSSSVRGSGPSQ